MDRRNHAWDRPANSPFGRILGTVPVLAAVLAAAVPLSGFGSEGKVLIPRESGRWTSGIRRAVDLVRKGDLRGGIGVLKGIVEDEACERALIPVPEGFGPGSLLAGDFGIGTEEGAGGGDEQTSGGPAASEEEAVEKEAPVREEEDAPAEEGDEVPIPPAQRGGRTHRLYLPVAEVARTLLDGLPAGGVELYRNEHEPRAVGRFRAAEAADDIDGIRRVAEDEAIASIGSEARDRLAERLFEDGRIWSALAWWRSILAGPAGSDAASSDVPLKILAALRILGREAEYGAAKEALLARLGAQDGREGLESPPPPDGTGTADGLLSRLAAMEAALPLRPAGGGISIFPAEKISPLPALSGGELALEWASSFWAQKTTVFRSSPDRALLQRRIRLGVSQLPYDAPAFPFFPAMSREEDGERVLYLNGVFALQRLSAATGRVVNPVFTKPVLNPDVSYFQESGDSPVYTTTVARSPEGADRIVIANFVSDRVESKSYMYYEITSEIPTRSLAAFDGATGQLLWHTGSLVTGQGGKVVSFTTPALVVGRKVFAAGWYQAGTINSVVVALDLLTGEPLWHQLIASNQMELTMFGEMGREPFGSVLAEREGTVYVVTNLGAVAALEGQTGRILWVSTYDSIPVESGEGQRSPPREIVWGVNPPLFLGEILVVTPRDSYDLYAFDASAKAAGERRPGRILWTYSNAGRDLRDLLGFNGGIAYFTGPGGVQGLDLRDVPEGGKPRKLPTLIHWNTEGVEGRGALTEAGVVVAAAAPGGGVAAAGLSEGRLWLVDLALKRRTPLSEPFSVQGLRSEDRRAGRPGSFSGNVTIADGRILVTSGRVIASFSPKVSALRTPAPAVPSAWKRVTAAGGRKEGP
jgi:outer membrane protein assembly factor BamB